MKIIDAHVHITPEFNFERLLKIMKRNEVERAVIMQNPTYGDQNNLVGSILEADSEHFAGVIQVDIWNKNAVSELERLAKTHLFSSLKLELSADWGF